MSDLWKIISAWDKFGQWVFILIVFGSVLGTISYICYLGVVLFRGWPPDNES
jgi:hypothetical protein